MPRAARAPLLLWRDLTPLPKPLVHPDVNSKHALVVGGGVTGLITAWVLLDRGFHVSIISKEWASWGAEQRLTSQIAGALWEYPPAVCGQHTDKISLHNSKRWCMTAYHVWNAMASDADLSAASGVRMKPSDFYFPVPIEQDVFQLEKMKEIMASGVIGFRRGANLIAERRVDAFHGGVDAYEILAPIIDTDTSMAWLMDLVVAKGADLHTRELEQDLLDAEAGLRDEFGSDIIVNCTGLAGARLAGDHSCYPIRGGLVRVINDGSDFPKVEAALTISADAAHDHNEIVFIVPRNDNILLLGGIAESNQWALDHTLDSPIIQRMKLRCENFLPDLKNARLDPEYPLAQGLRPFRAQNVRVERELRRQSASHPPSRIVHSYGQGGAGWSLSFGCAGDVLDLIHEALLDVLPRPMALENMHPVAAAGEVRAML